MSYHLPVVGFLPQLLQFLGVDCLIYWYTLQAVVDHRIGLDQIVGRSQKHINDCALDFQGVQLRVKAACSLCFLKHIVPFLMDYDHLHIEVGGWRGQSLGPAATNGYEDGFYIFGQSVYYLLGESSLL